MIVETNSPMLACVMPRVTASILLFVLISGATAQDPSEKPFPENRVRDYYAKQARQFLQNPDSQPKILSQFPGLDGGKWGHWGQNPESENFDHRLNEVDTGGLLMQVTRHFGKTTNKGVNVRIGQFTVLFDPERLTFVDAWRGDLVNWAANRYGITSGVEANGAHLNGLRFGSWQFPEKTTTKYLGFSRYGTVVEFEYRIGQIHIRDRLTVNEMDSSNLVRYISTSKELPEDVSLGPTSIRTEVAVSESPSLKPSSLWIDQQVKTQGTLGNEPGAYQIDTLTVPYRDGNPFKTPMRIGGVDILPDGRIAICTLMGDVWIVDGADNDLDQPLTWRRFASGLHQPLGLTIANGDVHVIGRDQLTRLHDRNDDGEADFYECVTNDFPTQGGNSFALTLHSDKQGRFYWFTRSRQFGMTRFVPGSKPESIATGLRGTNGTGVSRDGSIVLAMPQEGSWQPASAIFEVGDGSYHGFFGPRKEYGKHGYEMPLCFVPRGIDNSSGDVLFVPDDKRAGPLAGRIIGTSFGTCQHYLVLRENTAAGVQGGIVPLPGEFLSGAHRLRFSQHDGHIYVAGTDGWQSYATENGSLQRLRYTGEEMILPVNVDTRENGLLVTMNAPIDPDSIDRSNVFCQQWNYLHSEAYGSQEYSVKLPGTQGHDPVQIGETYLLPDRKTLFVEIPQLHPVMQLHLYMELKTARGQDFSSDIYYSIFHLGEPFTDFPNYERHAKLPWNDFPAAAENPIDPRLLNQERLGKIVGDKHVLGAIAKRNIATVEGLQFDTKQLEVPAGARVALTVTNKDPSMPHNWVLVTPGSLQRIGEGSMQLAASPEGAAKHYVIDDPGVLAMSPILHSQTSYIVYFDAPEKPGDYPYFCTFPGHWQLTRGILKVVKKPSSE